MDKKKYLYGASVQGIQSFIFNTNELKDVAGGSEIVEEICTTMFEKQFQQNGKLIVNAAGNVKCLFDNADECKNAVRLFPKTVMEFAPGITISEAVVCWDGKESSFAVTVEELERRLRMQRNRPMRSLTLGSMGTLRSRNTGMPVEEVQTIKGKKGGNVSIEYMDGATIAKRKHSSVDDEHNSVLNLAKKCFGNEHINFRYIAYNIEDLTNGQNDWIAVIHADGNGLGQIVAQKNHEPDELKNFSEKLDEATTLSAQQSYNELLKDNWYKPTNGVIPIRPVVLGGDDLTVICRADLAMRYVEAYIRHFEENTTNMCGSLTACAGIAYMKSSYPFYYGYRLAEALCEEAKKNAKKEERQIEAGGIKEGYRLAPSCVMFHKLQGCFVKNFNDIENEELTIDEHNSLKYGPYYLEKQPGRWTIAEIRDITGKLSSRQDNGNIAKSDIRQWLTLMHENIQLAEQFEQRIQNAPDKLVSKENKELFRTATTPRTERKISGDGNVYVYPAYDMLQMLTVETQITNNENKTIDNEVH